MSRKDALRQKLFAQGSAALAAARPGAPKGYACPICLMGYPTYQPFTLEDVPPKSIGGRPVVLTCAACNHTSGHELDAHIGTAASFADIKSGKKPLDARLSFAGATIAASVRVGPEGIDVIGDPARSSPDAHRKLFRALDAAVGERLTELTFNLSYRSKYDPWRENVGWLRIGYLYVFAMLGYNYILRPQLNDVRAQIKAPSDRILPYLVKRISEPSEDAIRFVFDPPRFRSIVVTVRDRFIMLPDFENPSTLGARIADLPPDEWPNTFTGKSLPLPRRPHFFADFQPSLVRLVSPDSLEPRER